MSDGLPVIHEHLEELRSINAADESRLCNVQDHVVEDWMEAFGLTRGQILDVIAVWLIRGFEAGRLDYVFADIIANDLFSIGFPPTVAETAKTPDYHTPLSWETYLAFDAGEYGHRNDFDPVEMRTRPLVTDIYGRLGELTLYEPALASLNP